MSATYGLDYNDEFVTSLPTVPASSPTSPPIPVLPTEELARLHLQHIVSHAPDSVLFPFLHGLEGSNAAQNTFFSSSDDVPRYRGMMYVVCDDDLEGLVMSTDDDTDDDTDDVDSSDELEEMDMVIDIDVEMNRDSDDGVAVHDQDEMMEIVGIDEASQKDDKDMHMHPVVMKPPPPLLPPPEYALGKDHSSHRPHRVKAPPILTSTFKPSELLQCTTNPTTGQEEWEFVPLRVPDGISLRNFGIQAPVLVTLSDIVIYSPTSTGAKQSENARRLAERFRAAITKKKAERLDKLRALSKPKRVQDSDQPVGEQLLEYNVFLLDGTVDDLLAPECPLKQFIRRCAGQRRQDGSEDSHLTEASKHNTINFALREKDEMRELTAASEFLRIEAPPKTPTGTIPETSDPGSVPPASPLYGQMFLGNSNDVPIPTGGGDGVEFDYDFGTDPSDTRSPTNPPGYDICIECHDLAPFPSTAHLRAAEEKLASLESRWYQKVHHERDISDKSDTVSPSDIPPRPPPHANSIIHLPFPSSPTNTASIKLLIRFLEKWSTPAPPPGSKEDSPAKESINGKRRDESGRRWSLLSSAPSFPLFHSSISTASSTVASPRIRSFTSPPPAQALDATSASPPSRPIRVLIYSSDGYTESSVLALSLLISLKNLSLPEAYLELQVAKQRSFFVYSADLGILRRWESEERGKDRDRSVRGSKYFSHHRDNQSISEGAGAGSHPHVAGWGAESPRSPPPLSCSVPKEINSVSSPSPSGRQHGRPRASTLPASSILGWDHQTWFDDPRFDGSFPSRVLPFLYLGNLNHASNAYMLHALGITHVVSVGECALVPPPNAQEELSQATLNASMTTHYMSSLPSIPSMVPGKGKRGSLWIEERAGRIKVLDIQGVCDDGIDTLEPQLEPICQWIDEAREEGGKVLVHCRVGVSRSATVTIAYVMKHLKMSLVEAYLIVRSRRLSVLIQPNMRLLYNLCGWEVKLAKQRAGDDEEKLKDELASAVTWPFLAKEVHKLNAKYLH